MKMIVYNGYPLSVFVAVTMHSLLLAALLFLPSESNSEYLDITQPAFIKAILLDENPQLINEQLLENARLIRLDQQRLEREADQLRQQEEQQQREQAAADQAAQQQRDRAAAQQLERDAVAQRERDSAALKERQELELKDVELARDRQQQREREQEQLRQREIAAEQERQRQEVAQAAAAEVARTEFEMVQAYTGIIHDLVQQNWSRPPSARNGMTAVLRIHMVPTGDILNVEIVSSSGDAAFDRAAETAINRVGRFTELQGMPTNMFNANFRTLLLTFRPEDLLN